MGSSGRKVIPLEPSELYAEADALAEAAERVRGARGPIDEVITNLIEAAEAIRHAARELDKARHS